MYSIYKETLELMDDIYSERRWNGDHKFERKKFKHTKKTKAGRKRNKLAKASRKRNR